MCASLLCIMTIMISSFDQSNPLNLHPNDSRIITLLIIIGGIMIVSCVLIVV